MKYSPAQNNKAALVSVVISLLVSSFVIYSLPAIFSLAGTKISPIVFTSAAVIGFIVAIYLTLRYGMTHFEYIIKPRDDGYRTDDNDLDFIVYKGIGSRTPAMECVLSLGDMIEVIPLRKKERTKNDVRRAYSKDGEFVYYDYTLTFAPIETLEIVFADGKRNVGIIIEDGNEISEYLRKYVQHPHG